MAREMLEGEGYGILEALNAEQAVRVATGYASRFILLLTDVVMPGASGQDLAQQLGLQRPAMKVRICRPFPSSRGSSSSQMLSRGWSSVHQSFSSFTTERLMEKVREVLTTKPASP